MPNADKSDKPRVLLIGDSICQGYSGTVEMALAGKAYVARLSTSRGIADPVLMDEIRALVRHHHFAVIHFNNGLHAIAYSAAEYEAGLKQVMDMLRKEGQGAKLVLSTSTFVQPGYSSWKSDDWNRQMVESRNEIVHKVAKTEHFSVDDLCAVTKDHPEYYAGDKIHFNAKGYSVLGGQVAASVEKALSDNPKKQERASQ
jgi:lysophospholipase L1-like esterase